MSGNLLEPIVAAKRRYGALRVYATGVNLEKGASYEIQSIIDDRTGAPREWRGKRKVAKGARNTHVVFALRQSKQDGSEYTATKDHLANDKAYANIVYPSLVAVVGKTNVGQLLDGNERYVCVEEYPTGDSYTVADPTGGPDVVKERTTWKLLAVYKTVEELKAAESEFFGQFESSDAADAAEVDENVPELYRDDPQAWYNRAEGIRDRVNAKVEAGKSLADAIELVAAGYDVDPKYIQAVMDAAA